MIGAPSGFEPGTEATIGIATQDRENPTRELRITIVEWTPDGIVFRHHNALHFRPWHTVRGVRVSGGIEEKPAS